MTRPCSKRAPSKPRLQDAARLQEFIDKYGRFLVRQLHTWLLLAQRSYVLPLRQP